MKSTQTFLLPLLLLLALPLVGCDDDDDGFLVANATMNWVLFDECSDGFGIQAALFESETGRVYPSRDSVYVADPGGIIDTVITCRQGAQVCYGAETDPPSGIFWGVGIDGTEGCDDCCDICNDNVVEFDLLCGNGVQAAPGASSSDGSPNPVRIRGESRPHVR